MSIHNRGTATERQQDRLIWTMVVALAGLCAFGVLTAKCVVEHQWVGLFFALMATALVALKMVHIGLMIWLTIERQINEELQSEASR